MNTKIYYLSLLLITAVLITEKSTAENIKSQSILFEEKFSDPKVDFIDTWLFEGIGEVKLDAGKLALRDNNAGVVLWTRQDFHTDVRLQFDLSFSNNRGIGVFFIAANGVDGTDIIIDHATRTGKYKQYTKEKINNYGFSLHRYYPSGKHNAGTNFRKNGVFNELHHVEDDPILQARRTYKIIIEKDKSHLRLWVDGDLIHDLKDDESTLGAGKIGFRLRGHPSCKMYLDNIIITSHIR